MACVLIVDDDTEFAAALAANFELMGLSPVVANDGREGLRLLRDGLQPAAIVLDLDMPSLSGVSFRFGQLANESVAGIPVVVCSGLREGAHTAELMGAAAFLPKPVQAAELLNTVRALAERNGTAS
jgi:DNA-binding response OmpR family regulator